MPGETSEMTGRTLPLKSHMNWAAEKEQKGAKNKAAATQLIQHHSYWVAGLCCWQEPVPTHANLFLKLQQTHRAASKCAR